MWLSRYSDWVRAGLPGFDSPQRQEIFPHFTASREALGSTHSPIEWEWRIVSRGVKRKADHSPRSAEIKNDGGISSVLHTSSWRYAKLSTRATLSFLLLF
jgi:hypothetical protein